MAVVDVLNTNAEKISEIELSEDVFNVPVKKGVLHQVVVMQQANKRSGSASVKHRSDIRGSGKKLFRQKGTGRARRGNIKAPLLRGGGVVFGPDKKSWAYKVPKRVRKLALKMALSSKFQDDELLVIDELKLERIKTQDLVKILKILKAENSLVVVDELDKNIDFSSRNIPKVKVMKQIGINVYDILKYKKLIVFQSALEGIQRRLAI